MPELNVIKLFSYDFSPEFSDWGLTCKVPIVTSPTVAEFKMEGENMNDYETSSGGITYATVQLTKQPKATFEFCGMDKLQAPNAPYWSKCAEASADVIKKSISETLGGLFTPENCAGGYAVLSSVTKANLAKLRLACVGRIASTVLALNPTCYAEALSLFDSNVFGSADPIRDGYIGKLYGFKAVMELRDLPNGVIGALVPENSLAFASRAVPVADESCYSEMGTTSDENGFTLTTMRHGSPAKGKGFLNVTALYGATLLPASNVKYICSTAPQG